MASQFKTFLGNRDIIDRFVRMAHRDGVPPALLFAGPEGVGKKTFALLAAQFFNCQQPEQDDSCGRCSSCLKITAGIHPDVRVIEPDGAQIKIEQTREMTADLQFRPFEGKRKVFILAHAEKLNEASASSILKMLEECPAYAWIVLITAHPDSLLPTIRSRCPVFRFAPIPFEELESFLKGRQIEPEKARTVARLSGGSVAQAISHDWEALQTQRSRVLSLMEHLGMRGAFHAVRAFWVKLSSEEQTRQEVEELFGTMLILLRDILLVKEGRASAIANVDRLTQLEKLAALYSFERISELEAQIGNALREMQRNVNPQILVESLYFEQGLL